MSRDQRLSVTDIERLFDLVSVVSMQGQCTPTEAIQRMGELLAPAAMLGRRRSQVLAEFVSRMRRLRMRRNEIIGAPLFRDPAWDMLLELFAAHQAGRRISISSLCYASGVPPTTALRQLARLEQHGLIRREGDPKDNRRYFVEATDKAIEGIGQAAALLMEESQVAEAADGEDSPETTD